MIGIFCSLVALAGLSFWKFVSKKILYGYEFILRWCDTNTKCNASYPSFFVFEDIYVTWNIDFFIALFYMAVGVSIGALSLLYIMIKNGEVSKVSSIFYLVPVSAAIVSYFLLNEKLELNVIIGIITVIIGITLINKR